MAKFAKDTSVSIDKSRNEITTILQRYGADGFGYRWQERDGQRLEMIEFTANDKHVRFIVRLPSQKDDEFWFTPSRGNQRSESAAYAAWEQSCRQRWRALKLCIQAKLEAVECGISTFESEFLAHIVDPSTGRTVGEIVLPQIEQLRPVGLPGLPDYTSEDSEVVDAEFTE